MKSRSILVIAAAALMLCACGREDAQRAQPATPVTPEGTSSGGGGFGDENSMKLLNWSKALTAASIRRANPTALKGLPADWTPERLAKLIENTAAEPRREAYRYNRELMFDYRIPKSGEPHLVATALFFRAHSAVPVNSNHSSQIEPYIREIRTKLLHEAAHVLGIGLSEKTDYKARAFSAFLTTEILAKNNVLCSTAEVPTNYPGYVDPNMKYENDKQNVKPESVYYWMINRPTGFALQALRSNDFSDIKYSWFEDLKAGKPRSYGTFALWPQTQKGVESPEYIRYFQSPFFVTLDEHRWASQYYKGTPLANDERLSLVGTDEISDLNRDGQRRNCQVEEKLEIPMSQQGEYPAALSFRDSCNFQLNSDDPNRGQLTVGAFAVKCIESFRPLSSISEFLGEQAFTDPWLKEWERTNDQYD